MSEIESNSFNTKLEINSHIEFINRSKSETDKSKIILVEGIVNELLSYITRILSISTTTDYHLKSGLTSGKLTIDLILPSNSEDVSSLFKLVSTKMKLIKNTIESIDFKKSQSTHWDLRTLLMLNVDINNLFTLDYDDISDSLHLSTNGISPNEIRLVESIDSNSGLTIRQFIDPLLTDYGLYIDHSKRFSDFCLCWDCLHLYEHLSVPWKLMDEKSLINGFTTPNGICICYIIVKSKSSLVKSFNEYIDYHNKFKKSSEYLKERIELEQQRTYTETLQQKELSLFGRSDPDVYSTNGYDTNIFNYYLNQPFTILLTTPVEIDVTKLKKLTSMNKIEKPKTRSFKTPPISMFRSRVERDYIIEDLNHATQHSYYGVDCVMNSSEDLSNQNLFLFRTLLRLPFNKCKERIHSTPIPFYNLGIMSLDDNCENIKSYFMDVYI